MRVLLQRRSFAAFVSAFGLLTSLMLAGNQGASASTINGCRDGYWCIYQNTSYGGAQCSWVGNDGNYGNNWGYPGVNCNDMMTSFINNGHGTYSCVQQFFHANYHGHMLTSYPRGYPIQPAPPWADPWVGNYRNDKASSHYWSSC